MDAAEEMEWKFAASFLENEDYGREGDSSELVKARAELAALQNKFENMGFVAGPVMYVEQVTPRTAPHGVTIDRQIPVMASPTATQPPPLPPTIESPAKTSESTAILELTKTLASLIQESKKEQREHNARLEAMMRNMRPIAVRAPMQGGMAAAQVAAGPAGTATNACFTCHQPGHLARDCPHRAMQPRSGIAPAAAAPIANGPGRVGAVMDDQGGSTGMMISSEEAAELIPLEQYVSLGYPGLGMIGTIRLELESRDVAEWRPSVSEMETGDPTFVTGEIDILEVTRALDHRIPLPIGHLLSISEQANERMMQHCKANRKRFALARAKDQKAKAPPSEKKVDVAPDPIRVGLIQKDDHFLRIEPIPWKSAECDIEVWGVPYSAIIDSGAAVLAISLRVVERADRKNDLIMLTEKDQLVSADEEKIKTVGRMTNVAFRLGKVHALGDVVVLDVNTYDVLFGLLALVALRANLDFERRSVILRNTGGKPYWVRCPMGICNAPATFQRAMNVTFHNFVNKTRLTQGMINFCVIVYMDDILVYSDTFHGHARHIEWTLGALRDTGFKIALEKSEFFLPEISFLGYVVTRGGLRPDSRKVAAVKEAPIPTSLMQVRAFLGLASYYRRFIKGFATISRPLTNLLRKEQPLHWDDECDQAFGALKDALITAPILIRPDPSRQFILITDWQSEAISAILAQKGNDGKEHVIEYASRTVPDERQNDSSPQGECYAVVWGIEHFHPYLYGQKFLLVTDHEPPLTLKKLTNYTGMIGRWAVRLQEYEFDIVHRKTERHDNADGLTRLHRPGKVPKAEEITPWKDPDINNGPKYGEVAIIPRGKKPSDLHPRLSFCIDPLVVPLLDPSQWDVWRGDFIELSLCLAEVRVTWTRDESNYPRTERLELLLIQAWRTEVEGDLLGFLFGAVRPGCRRLLTQELMVPIAQLADHLDVSIVSQVDPRLVPHITSRTLSPYLQWSACVEGFPSRIPSSRLDYLDPRDIVDPAFYRPPCEDELEEILREELTEESSEEEEENLNEDEGEMAPHQEGDEDELLQTESEEEAEEEDSEQGSGDDNDEEQADEDPQLEIASIADLPISNDPMLDPEPPQPDDDHVAQIVCLSS
ncbi:hypothetical protein CBR_g29968 [Chara braunii]|uniref:CCHC-type domain-containing protein n=1 Tax=Chara braunii TaxID=69332 RepID=A0A388LBN8_CHABU|nr:hypothetical protein CBR_g29968 [Chara braunii]|eukprot:GBG79704.1 hypothetical protein CBR_g29968 [Chara braunii]